jgi:hypothetical protein
MSTMISRGKELIRIRPDNPTQLEYSTSSGRVWSRRYNGNTSTGTFIELIDNGREILASTNKGIFYSTNEGRVWSLRKRI